MQNERVSTGITLEVTVQPITTVERVYYKDHDLKFFHAKK